VEEALLSDEAVEAVAAWLFDFAMKDRKVVLPARFSDVDADQQDEWQAEARTALQAALKQVGQDDD
jgi:hypothetical protein